MKNMIAGIIGLLMFVGCTNSDTTVNRDKEKIREVIVNKDKLLGYDYRLFQGTKAWDLAKAVDDENTDKITKIASNDKSLLEEAEPRFGQTLLQLAVKTLKYESVKKLVELGADPNKQDKYDGSSPLMAAAEILLLDVNKPDPYGSNPKFLKLLLQHGGDPNAEQKGPRRKGNGTRYTPLLKACGTRYIEYVKLLVEAGAKVNYVNEYGMSPLQSAAMFSQDPEMVMYLISKGADFKQPLMKTFDGKNLYLTDLMRAWRFELNTDEFKKKMALVDFLKKSGMDYRKTEIPKHYLDDYPKEYLDKY